MRFPLFRLSALAVLAWLATFAPPAGAGGSVNILVLKEHGIGSAAQAQPYVDKFVALAARQNGWSAAEGKYVTRRSQADTYIADKKPHYGILSLAAFLAMKAPQKLTVVGVAEVTMAGGRRYHVISKNASDLAGCKGNSLATDHADDPRFINQVVAAGAFSLDDFKLVPTTRPVQTIKKVTRGEALCALVDDAQMAELNHIDGANGVASVWKSRELPPMPVVAFPTAPASERSAFQSKLGALCTGEGAAACKKVGIQKLQAADASTYASVLAAYGK